MKDTDTKLLLNVLIFLQDKEILNGGHAPRILAIDDYFLTEVEKYEKDPETGRKVKRKASIAIKCLILSQSTSERFCTG